jgi:hypothetical protein
MGDLLAVPIWNQKLTLQTSALPPSSGNNVQKDFITFNHGSQGSICGVIGHRVRWKTGQGKCTTKFPLLMSLRTILSIWWHSKILNTLLYSCFFYSCKVLFSDFTLFSATSQMFLGWEMGGTGSGLCTMAGFSISGVEPSWCPTRVSQFRRWYIWANGFHYYQSWLLM